MYMARRFFLRSRDGMTQLECKSIKFFQVVPVSFEGTITSGHAVTACLSKKEGFIMADFVTLDAAIHCQDELTMMMENGDVASWSWPDITGSRQPLPTPCPFVDDPKEGGK